MDKLLGERVDILAANGSGDVNRAFSTSSREKLLRHNLTFKTSHFPR
jgi:hypothetical protein